MVESRVHTLINIPSKCGEISGGSGEISDGFGGISGELDLQFPPDMAGFRRFPRFPVGLWPRACRAIGSSPHSYLRGLPRDMAHSRRCRIPGLVLNLRLRRVGVIGASPPVCIELATKKRRKKSRTDTIVFRTPELCIPDTNFIFFTRPYPAARFGSPFCRPFTYRAN